MRIRKFRGKRRTYYYGAQLPRKTGAFIDTTEPVEINLRVYRIPSAGSEKAESEPGRRKPARGS